MKYVALLRGINVGGNKKVPMADLRKTFEKSGFQNVRTLLNSGNVVFETDEKNEQNISQRVETLLEQKFGWHIFVMLRSHDDLINLVKNNPFKSIVVTKDIRRYVSFFKQKFDKNISDSEIIKPLYKSDSELCYVIDVSDTQTTKAMEANAKNYKNMIETTRNWNTVEKLAIL